MQVCKTRAVRVHGEHRAISRTAARLGCSIKRVTGQNHGLRSATIIGSVEIIQVRKTRAIGMDGENCAGSKTASVSCRAIQRIAR